MKRDRAEVERPAGDEGALWGWLAAHLGLRVARRSVCAGHQAPFEYLKSAYFEPGRDVVVWAPRGGGKTTLGAAATLLDLLHKPGVAVRILGGSLEQSMRMWEHLVPGLERVGAAVSRAGARRVELVNGSGAAVLTQSERAVRGQRVQKVRCDEVELFDPAVWEAAQLATRSTVSRRAGGRRGGVGGGTFDWEFARAAPAGSGLRVAGAVEALSTLHVPGGLMQRIAEGAEARGARLVRWCLMEVLERCPAERPCAGCPLWEECGGAAKTRCDGHLSVEDAVVLKGRVSAETWETEMLCRRPSVRGRVFPTFGGAGHVDDVGHGGEVTLAVDFGFANPFVCLWVADDGERVHVIDEYVQEQRTVEEHLVEIERRGWGAARRVACDPAGAARNEQTATSNVQLLRSRGYQVRFRKSGIVEGIEMIRAGLRSGTGAARLSVHPRCGRLIEALRGYRYAEGGGEVPVKDGRHDHLIDALRYFYVNRGRGEVRVGRF